MRIRIKAIAIVILSLSSLRMTAQDTFSQLKEVFLTEGIRVDCYVLAEEMSRLLKPNEPAQPQRIKQLEEQLQSAYISERQAIAKELVPLQKNYISYLMENTPSADALVINMAELCYYVYLSGDPDYISYYEAGCRIAIEANRGDLLAGYFALLEDRFLQNPCIMLGDYYLEQKDTYKANLFYTYGFPIAPSKEGELWNITPDNTYSLFELGQASRHLYKTLLTYPLFMYRLAKVAVLDGASEMFEYMNEAFLSAVDAIQWSLLRDDISEHERLLELYGPIFKLQYGNIDPCWAYNAALFLKNASTYASLDLKKIYVDPIDLDEWGGYRADKSEWERYHGMGSYAAYAEQEKNKLRKAYPYEKYQEYLDARSRTLKNNTSSNIKRQAELYERLLRGAFFYKGYLSSVKKVYKDVYEALPDGSCAVEFITFDNILTGEIEYLALVLRHDNPTPYRFRLCSESELQSFCAKGADIYRPQRKEAGQFYNTIWSQIEEVTKDINTIYFSPDGLLATTNIESLCDPVSGLRFFEKKNVHRVSSTKQVCLKSKEYRLDNAVLYGGLNYGLSIGRMVEQNKRHSGYISASRGYRGDGGAKAWTPLSGSSKEISDIRDILLNKGVAVSVRKGDTATEEDFKSLSSGKSSIIHIATHGFYRDNRDVTDMKYYQDIIATDMGREYSPMRRSGLIFSGANNAWLGKSIPTQVEDGILLAEEIAAMELSNTALVVLSACETGLGEASSEGMNGLQKAFKRAGVDKLIISLGKVHDWATQQFMTAFYSYLSQGFDIYQSFQLAKATMMESDTFSDPSYWASFILLE